MDNKIGIEIECENCTKVIEGLDYWKATHEPMLKGGVEYVLSKPTDISLVNKALEELFDNFTNEKFTSRCSTHIHINVKDMSRTQVYNFITLYVMFEPVILEMVSDKRRGNLFATPVYNCYEVQEQLTIAARDNLSWTHFRKDLFKYCAINMSSIHIHGSLEFRSLQGTRNKSLIKRWIDVHLALKKYAMEENLTPLDIIVSGSAGGFKNLFEAVMGNLSKTFKKLTEEELEFKIKRGMRNAQDIAFQGEFE